jgi:hypothetical protein
MEAELTTNSQPVPSWLEKSPADLKIIPRNLSSQMTTSSFDTDFTSTTNDMESIITAQQQLDDRAIRLQYEQLPEKIPDIFAEMEKWFALTDR